MRRLAGLLLLIVLISALQAGCAADTVDLVTESGIVGEWGSGSTPYLIYEPDGEVVDLDPTTGDVISTGTYSIEQSDGRWVEVYTGPDGDTSRYFFEIKGDMIYFEDAQTGESVGAYQRVK
jgi:hypothetical protein